MVPAALLLRSLPRAIEDMEDLVSKIDAAVHQLDWAIKLFLDSDAYIPAITLAGAAEEILGQTLQDRAVFAHLKAKLAADFGLAESVISQAYLNRAKNWLKHWQNLRDEETITLDLEAEAVQYLSRAITNLVLHTHSMPKEGQRFFEWLAAHSQRLNIDTF